MEGEGIPQRTQVCISYYERKMAGQTEKVCTIKDIFFLYIILMVGTFCMTTRDLLHDKQGALTELTCPKTSSTPNNSYHVRTYDKCSFLSVTLV